MAAVPTMKEIYMYNALCIRHQLNLRIHVPIPTSHWHLLIIEIFLVKFPAVLAVYTAITASQSIKFPT